VGGDFFDILRLEYGRVGIAVADVSDKGVPAALFMMSSRTLLKGAAIGSETPGDVLREVNDLLNEENDTAMFVTVVYAMYDPVTHKVTYANGGHNPPLIVHADGSSELLPLTGGIALGIIPGIGYQQTSVTLSPGDTVFFYTDGVTEAMNEEGEEFGIERLSQVFESAPPTDSESATEAVFEAVHAFAGDTDQSDDITCVTFHRRAS
jgi:sigma-B regulation protein RsbU (phosphoserine phosphatase)